MAITIKNMGGGAELTGNASTDNVLSGKTFYNTDGTKKLTGTMPNKGAITQTLEPQQTFYIPKGYHNGSGTVKATGVTQAEYDNVAAELADVTEKHSSFTSAGTEWGKHIDYETKKVIISKVDIQANKGKNLIMVVTCGISIAKFSGQGGVQSVGFARWNDGGGYGAKSCIAQLVFVAAKDLPTNSDYVVFLQAYDNIQIVYCFV